MSDATAHHTPKRSLLNLSLLWVICLASIAVLAWSAKVAWSRQILGWELDVFRALNDWLPNVRWIEISAEVISLTSWIAVFSVIGLYAIKRYRYAWRFSVAIVAAYGIALIIEHFVARERPGLLIDTVMLRAVQDGYGFPSSHASVTTAVALLLVPILPRVWRWVPIVWIIAVCWSRVYLGVHAPLDVVGGIALGVTIVTLYYILPDPVLAIFRLNRHHVKSKDSEEVHHSPLASRPLQSIGDDDDVVKEVEKPSAPPVPARRSAPKKAASQSTTKPRPANRTTKKPVSKGPKRRLVQ